MELDLRQLLRMARRWWWILLLAPLISGATAYFVSNQQTPLYSASVTIRINPPASSSLDPNAFRVSQDLTETYRQLIVLQPVLDQVIDELSLPFTTSQLRSDVTATTVRDTQLVRIAVSNEDPDQAALIANTLASTFSRYVAEESLGQIEATRASLDEQIAEVRDQVESLDAEISTLDTEANQGDTAIQTQIDDLRAQRSRLQQQIADLEVQGQSVSIGIASAQTQVTVSAPASAPSAPYAPRVTFYTVLGVFVGLLIAVAAIALLQYLDNSVHGDVDVQQLLGVPVLSTVPTQSSVQPGGNQVYVIADPRSQASESIRMLRANLEFAFAGRDVKTLAISSASPEEGKSTVAANLAVVMAQAGLSTVLIDADLRKPTQHRIFGIPNDEGLTTLLTHPERPWKDVSTRVATSNLFLLPSGPIPPNPSDLLSIDHFPKLLKEIGETADLVVIDTPPILAVADPLVVARKSDAALLVTRAGKTRRDAVRKAVDALQNGNVWMPGVVINQQKIRGSSYYAYREEPESKVELTDKRV
jgi:non-specific protein-tyrosine kinase